MTTATKSKIKSIVGHLQTALILTCIIAFITGWTWFVWNLASAGSSIWERVGWVVGSYFAIWILAYIASIPGVGCIPVKFDR